MEDHVAHRYGEAWIRIRRYTEDGTARITEYRQTPSSGVIFLRLADEDADLEEDEPLSVRKFRTLTAALKQTFDAERTPTPDRMYIEISGDRGKFAASLVLRRAGMGVCYFEIDGELLGFDGHDILDARLTDDHEDGAEDALRPVWNFRAFLETGAPWDRDIDEMVGEADGIYFYVLSGDDDHMVIKLGRYANDKAAIRAGKLRSPRSEKDRRRLARMSSGNSPTYYPAGVPRKPPVKNPARSGRC